jgi:membrane fusion protein, multidrug efflux system
MKTREFAGLLMVVAAAAVMLFTGCSRDRSQRAGPPAVPVLADVAVSMDVPVKIGAIGTVEALNSAAVTAQVSGRVLEVAFAEGQDVNEGYVLFQIDPAPYRAALGEARANLKRDQARLDNAGADVARYTDLVAKDYVTKQEYDLVVSTAASAKATVEADEAAVQSDSVDLDHCTIRAPIAGRTGNLLVKRGNVVGAGSQAAMVTINQIAPIYVRFAIPEQQLPDVRRYSDQGPLSVQVFLPSDTSRVYTGKLTFIDNTVDAETGTVLLKATFPNEDRALWPGQFVQVELVLTIQANATVVPSAAVQASQQGEYIYVIRADDTAEQRPVVRGVKIDDKVVITSGAEAGERVVTDGQLRLTPGAKVAIKSGLAPGGPGSPGSSGTPAGAGSPGSPGSSGPGGPSGRGAAGR